MAEEYLHTFVAGTVSGVIGVLLEYPLDTLKVRLQAHGPLYNGYWDCAQKLIREEGPKSFYHGVSTRFIGSGFEHAVVFSFYKCTLRALGADEFHPLAWQIILGGVGGGVASTVFLTPLELVKCHLQISNSLPLSQRQYTGVWDCAVKIVRHGGVPALYRGGVAMLAREVPGTAAYCGTYDKTKELLTPAGSSTADLAPWRLMIAGGFSGVAFWTIFFPADVVKTRMQLDPVFAKYGFVQALRVQYTEGGVRALYCGWSLTAARAFPSNAAIFVSYDMCMRLFSDPRTHLWTMPKRALSPRSSARERRKRGTHIKCGLDELGDLDAAPTRPRHERVPEPIDHCTAAPGPSAAGGDTDGAAAVLDHPIAAASRKWQAARSVFGQCWDEWHRVKHLLFHPPGHADAVDARRMALDHIQLLWRARARRHRPVPPYAEATALLLEAVVLDEGGQLSSSGAVAFYGAAISRVVHILTGTFAVGTADTYRKRAKMIGFPEEAVEVRQRVAHGALPLLSELRWVCGLVLQFLFQSYWLEQERHARLLEEEERENENEEEDEKKIKKGDTGARSGNSATKQHTTLEEMQELLRELSDLSSNEGNGDDIDDTDGKKENFVKKEEEDKKEEEVKTKKENLTGGWVLTG